MVRVIDGTGGHLAVPGDLDAFEIRVSSLTGPLDGGTSLVRYRRSFRLAHPGARERAVTLPQTLAIVPAETGAGTVRVDVYGLKNGHVLQRIHRIAAFGVGLVELPPFVLTPLCFGIVCPEGQTCEADGMCRDATDTCSSGGCDAGTGPCGAFAVSCGDRCVPSDDSNCGACGRACAAGQRCVANTCTCAAGSVSCGGECVDVATDEVNCGACGTVCNAPNAIMECNAGSCDVVSCTPGFHDCDGMPANGCEIPDCSGGGGGPCTTSCGSMGTLRCGATACASMCEPPGETCNGIDDDCDGTVDECEDDGVCFRGACAYPPLGCSDARVRDDHLYAVCDEPTDWFIASDVCFEWDGYLVTIDDAAEDAWVRSIAPGFRWIGYNDIFDEGLWEWEVGGGAYEGWCPEEPSSTCCYGEFPGCAAAGADQDCVVLGYGCEAAGIGWDDQHCCELRAFVCEAH
jgi:hypothetical protein